MKTIKEFFENIEKCENLEKILNSSKLELYEKNITELPCEDGFNHFIIFFENKYYLVLSENDYDLVVEDCFDSLSECQYYYIFELNTIGKLPK